MTETLLHNAARVATGDVQRPLIEGPTDIRIADGVIASVGPSAGGSMDVVIDASHLLVMPGLWDAHHHPYFGDHTPEFDARGYLAETVRAGTTTVVSAGIPPACAMRPYAPTVCPTPPAYTANSLGTINLKTDAVGKVALTGPITPKGLIFIP